MAIENLKTATPTFVTQTDTHSLVTLLNSTKSSAQTDGVDADVANTPSPLMAKAPDNQTGPAPTPARPTPVSSGQDTEVSEAAPSRGNVTVQAHPDAKSKYDDPRYEPKDYMTSGRDFSPAGSWREEKLPSSPAGWQNFIKEHGVQAYQELLREGKVPDEIANDQKMLTFVAQRVQQENRFFETLSAMNTAQHKLLEALIQGIRA